MELSAHGRAKAIESIIRDLLSAVAIDELDATTRKAVVEFKRTAADTRLDIRDYEFADTRVGQLHEANAAKKRLLVLRDQAVELSQYGIGGPVEIAELSANIDLLVALLD